MQSLGSKGEDLAAKFLRKKGYRIIERNYKTSIGEIDIIAQDGGTIVFIEVKTRTNDAFGHPFEAVDKRKRQKLKNLALFYMKKQSREVPVRFDVLSIFHLNGRENKIQHIMDAFEV